MNIYVLTSTKYTRLLPEFADRFQKYWGEPFTVYVSNTDINHWSDGVISLLNNINDEYFVLLHEDFYLTQMVDKQLIKRLWDNRVGYERISLLGNHTPERTTPAFADLYKHKYGAEYCFSFEASIQNRDFLLRNLKPGLDPWESERVNKKVFGEVLSSEKPAIWYEDKSRQLQLQ